MSATLQTPCELPSVTCRQRLLAKRRAAWRGAAMRDLDRRRRMGYGSASGVSGRQGLGTTGLKTLRGQGLAWLGDGSETLLNHLVCLEKNDGRNGNTGYPFNAGHFVASITCRNSQTASPRQG
jgi:hypothetical protein